MLVRAEYPDNNAENGKNNMTETATKAGATTEKPKTFEFPISFSKTHNFRAVHSNGIWFSGDTEGNIHLMFYNDYFPSPQKIVALLNENGQVVGENELKREALQGTVREMEVDVILSQDIAAKFHKMLGDNLEAIRKAQVK
jgi:hypothetical protein